MKSPVWSRLLGGAALLLALTGCYVVPETGRKSLILTSPAEDAAMGAQEFASLRSKEKVSDNPILNDRVRRVGKRIAEAVGNDLPSAKWEFVVFEAKDVNAFALPGGKVGVYTGLLKVAETDDELAIVMGHEIAHVTARHGAERMTEMLGAALGAAILEVSTQNSSKRDAWRIGYGLAATGTTLKFSRNHESEADYIGLRYAAKAGYDPRAAVDFWQKMAKQKEGAKLPAFLSTHPSDEQRIANLEKAIPAVLPLYETAKQRYE